MRDIRGNEISMIFQEPMTSLNPVLTIGAPDRRDAPAAPGLVEARGADKAVEMLRLVQIPEPAQRAKEYPHQLSGGMRQRAMIAMALACNPRVLIADEPTTALDVTIQAQILDLILDLQKKLGTAIILITHDLGVVAETAQRVIVMYAGKKVEEADGRGRCSPRRCTPIRTGCWPRSRGSRSWAASRRSAAAAEGNSRHGAGAEQSAARLHVCAALRLRRRPLPRAVSRLTSKSARAIGRRAGIRRGFMAGHAMAAR